MPTFPLARLTILSFFLLPALTLQGEIKCDHFIPIAMTKADGRENFRNVRPGQTVCLEAGLRRRLALENFRGAEGAPITFVNSGGQVVVRDTHTFGIAIRNSRYFRLTGSGDPSFQYGIDIAGVDIAVRAGWKSSDMEFDHLKLWNLTGQGILANTKAYCEDGSTNTFDFDHDGQILYDLDDVVSQSTFIQYNTSIHDNYIYDVGDEALYIGSNRNVYASYSQGQPDNCRRGTRNPLHPVLHGVDIYSNVIRRTGRDAINVKGAPVGCKVYGNVISEDSTARMGIRTGRWDRDRFELAL